MMKHGFLEAFYLVKTHESQMNRFVTTAFCDTADHRCDISDELDPSIVNAEGARFGIESKAGQMIKQRLTVEKVQSVVLTIDADGQRVQSVFRASVSHSPLAGNSNTDLTNADPATVSRVHISPFLPIDRVGDLPAEPGNKDSLKRITFLTAMLSVMQKAGVVEFPDLSGFDCFLKRLKDELRKNPFVFTSYDDAFDRKAGAMKSLIAAHMNLTAVLNVFMERNDPFRPAMFLECNKYLVPSEKDFVLIASHMRNDFCSDIIMSVGRCLASGFRKNLRPDLAAAEQNSDDARRDRHATQDGALIWNKSSVILESLRRLSIVSDDFKDGSLDELLLFCDAEKWAPYVHVFTVVGGNEKQASAESYLLEKIAKKVKVYGNWPETNGMEVAWIANVLRKLMVHNISCSTDVAGTNVYKSLQAPHPAVRIDVTCGSGPGSGSNASLYVSRCLLNETVLQYNTFARSLEAAVKRAGNCEAGVYITAEQMSLAYNARRKAETDDEKYLGKRAEGLAKPVIPFLASSFVIEDHSLGCPLRLSDPEFSFTGRLKDCSKSCFRRNTVGVVGKTAISSMHTSESVLLAKLARLDRLTFTDDLCQAYTGPESLDDESAVVYPQAAIHEVAELLRKPPAGRALDPGAPSALADFRAAKRRREAEMAADETAN
jgi:hypothetical protein